MAKLINGNGNPAVYAAEDADMLAGIMGNITTITAVGNEFAATASGANLIEVADGVILTQEGRRIQLDAGLTDAFTIPSGTAGTTNYYIIGYRLYESASGTQECETFVQLMASASDTIPEDTFRGGATEVFVSLYRVEQDGVNLGTISLLLPKVSGVSQINADLSDNLGGTTNTFKFATDGSENYGYIKKVGGADTFFPFKSGDGMPSYSNAVSLTLNSTYTPLSDGIILSVATQILNNNKGSRQVLTINGAPVLQLCLLCRGSTYDYYTYGNAQRVVKKSSTVLVPDRGEFYFIPCSITSIPNYSSKVSLTLGGSYTPTNDGVLISVATEITTNASNESLKISNKSVLKADTLWGSNASRWTFGNHEFRVGKSSTISIPAHGKYYFVPY